MSERFDVIVVGAGLAGSSAAIVAARSGLKVLVLERGPYVGAKNMTGGMVYARVLEQVVPEYWKDAPLERPIVHNRIMMTSGGRAMTLDIGNESFGKPPYNGFSVLRRDFDPWLAGKAEEAGAVLVTSTVVDDLLVERGRVVGVRTRRDRGEVRGDVVILADGVNSLLARKAGLRRDYGPHDIGLGVKELIALPEDAIDARFGLGRGKGASYAVIGDFAKGIPGGGFMYTNTDTVSVGVVAHPDALVEQKVTPSELLERFKSVPEIARLLEGGETIEYSGHLVGESGMSAMRKIVSDGVLVAGDAAGFIVNTGIVLAGMNLAVSSGCCAGKAAVQAHERGDFSERGLGSYHEFLEGSVAKSMVDVHERAPEFIRVPRLYDEYPEMVNNILEDMVSFDGGPVRSAKSIVKEQLGAVRTTDLLRDVRKGAKAL